MPRSSSLADDPGAVAEQMHPRPHLVRFDWLSLDGPWDFAFDADDRGERERWFQRREPWPARIVVPFPWESPRSGVGGPAPDRYVRGGTVAAGPAGGVGWYRRRVIVPPGWHGQRIWLVVGAAYWHSRIWIDGTLAAAHDGGYDPFEADVTDLPADASDFWAVIRVWAPEDTDEYPHGKNTRHWYSRASGIWQTVFVEPRPATHVETLRVIPDLASGALDVRARVCAGSAGAATLRMEVTLRGRAVAADEVRVELSPGVSSHGLVARLTSVPEAWSPETPVLYEVRVTVAPDGEPPDQVATTFGFRTIGFAPIRDEGPRWLHLNGVPLYVRGVMSQGYHPDGLLTYPDEATIVHDLAEARRLGFNLVRLHVKMEDPRVLAWADRLGILLWCEVPDILTPADAAKERWEKTWRAMIERDAGHPSIVLWCMFIESWGLGINQFGFGGAERRFADDPAMQAWVGAMYALGRSLDPTRPIIENSTSEADHTVAEVNDIHLFPTGYGELQASAAATLDAYVANAYPGSRDNFAPGHVQDVQPLMVTSMAGWSSVDGVETSWPLLALVNEVRARESIAGYGWVQLYDVEWELTGLETYDRRQKAFGYEVARLNSDDVLVVRGPLARAVDRGATMAIEVALAHASGRVTGDVHAVAWLEGVDAAWRHVLTPTRSIGPTVCVDRLGVIPLGTVALTAPEAAFCGRIRIAVIATEARVVATGSVLLATDSERRRSRHDRRASAGRVGRHDGRSRSHHGRRRPPEDRRY